jgi:rod shape-determining protein MreD
MRMGATEKLYAPAFSRFFAALVPLLCGLALVFIANIPISFVGGVLPPPLLGLIPIYFWCLVRPDLMTPAAAFAIGMLEDVMSGAAPGVWTLSFVLSYALVSRQRESFAGLAGLGAVLGFAAASFAAIAAAYAIVSVYYGDLPPLGPVVAQLAMTVAAYIPVTYFIAMIHHRIVGPLRSDF